MATLDGANVSKRPRSSSSGLGERSKQPKLHVVRLKFLSMSVEDSLDSIANLGAYLPAPSIHFPGF